MFNSYMTLHPAVSMSNNLNIDVDSLDLLIRNQVDAAFITRPLTTFQALQHKQIKLLPLLANPLVIIYRLDKINQQGVLTLDLPTLARIFQRNITHWDDPAIVASNPTLAALLPHGIIKVHTQAEQYGINYVLTNGLGKVSSEFASRIPASVAPDWPSSFLPHETEYGLSGAVLTNDMSIGYCILSTAEFTGASIAQLINSAGATVYPTISSTQVALTEAMVTKMTSYAQVHSQVADATITSSYNSWPFVVVAYVAVSLTESRTSCAARSELIDLLLYCYQSNTFKDYASLESIALMPDIVVQTYGIFSLLENQMMCRGNNAWASSTNSQYQLPTGGGSLVYPYASMILNLYSTQPSNPDVRIAKSSSTTALDQVARGEIGVALIVEDLLDKQSDLYQYSKSIKQLDDGSTVPSFYYLPSFVSGMAFMYCHRVGFLVKNDTSHSVDSLEGLTLKAFGYNLVLDVDTAAMIFLGFITTWTHPRIIAYNPYLSAKYAQPGSDPRIIVFAVCNNNRADVSMGYSFALFFNRTSPFFRSHVQLGTYNEFDWCDTMTSKNPDILLQTAAGEDQLNVLASNTDGAVGYALFDANDLIDGQQVHFIRPKSVATSIMQQGMNKANDWTSSMTPQQLLADGVSDIIAPLIENFGACSSDTFSQSQVVLELQSSHNPNCWPLSFVISSVLPSTYSSVDGSCAHGRKAAELAMWLHTASLTDSAAASGMIRPVADSTVQDAVVHAINYMRCDSKTMLITLPDIWKLNSAIKIFTTFMSSIGMIACTILAGFLIVFRERKAIKSASVHFLLLNVSGLALLFITCFLVISPSDSTCGAMIWTGCLGYTLCFSPLFAKTYRIYMIFSPSRKLKVVKISNLKLMSFIVMLIICEMILLAILQGIGPVTLTTTLQVTASSSNSYDMCSFGSPRGLPILVILAVEKALLLVFGAMMGFSTRKVTSLFNEASSIAWTIYNTFFCLLIIVPIILFVNAIGDTLILLEVLLILWISSFTLVCFFWPKLMGSRVDVNNSITDANVSYKSNGSTASYSFMPIQQFSKESLLMYLKALGVHTKNATKRYLSLGGSIEELQDQTTTRTELLSDGNTVTVANVTTAGEETQQENSRSKGSAMSPSPAINRPLSNGVRNNQVSPSPSQKLFALNRSPVMQGFSAKPSNRENSMRSPFFINKPEPDPSETEDRVYMNRNRIPHVSIRIPHVASSTMGSEQTVDMPSIEPNLGSPSDARGTPKPSPSRSPTPSIPASSPLVLPQTIYQQPTASKADSSSSSSNSNRNSSSDSREGNTSADKYRLLDIPEQNGNQ